ncbi:MAG: hypothetical protein M5U26_05220 [Planctomycetota bacterium]|nr:hypothetical protein [Planctomycetota bacterium]
MSGESAGEPPPPQAPPGPRAWPWLLPLLLAPALIAPCWNAPFTRIDDPALFLNSATLKPETPYAAVLDDHPEQFNYYPLTMLRWKAERALWAALLGPALGEDAWAAGLRLSNLVYHLLGALFLWLLLRRLGAGPALAGFVTAAFALHPLAVESVAWPAEGKTAFAGFFALAAAWAYVRAKGAGGHALAAALFAAALLSKPSALGVVAVLAVWELLGRPRLDDAASGRPTREPPRPLGLVLRLLPWAVLAGLCAYANLRAHARALAEPPGGSVFTALLTDVPILARYAWNLLMPVGLSAFYGVAAATSLADGRVWGCGAALAALCGGFLALARPGERRMVLFGLLWFLAALGPNLNLAGLTHLMQDRFIYLAAPGFWLAAGLAARGGAERIPAAWGAPPRWAPHACAGVLCLAWSFAAAQRSRLYADTQALLFDAVRREPGNSYAQFFLADEFRATVAGLPGKMKHPAAGALMQRQFEHLEAALAAPDFKRNLHRVRIQIDYGHMLWLAGRDDEARAILRRAIDSKQVVKLTKDLATAQQVLGLIAFKRGEYEEALGQFDAAILNAPAEVSIQMHRAKALAELAQFDAQAGRGADAARRRALAVAALKRIAPEDEAYADAQALLKELEPP